MYRARLQAIFHGAESSVLIAFWFFGLINNVLYVIIISAALDLVGPNVPKSVVLLADVLPSFVTKLLAPYFIHKISYSFRILIICFLSSAGMLLVALTPATSAISIKMIGVTMASLSAGGGELSFLSLTHYYGHFSLAAWGSGTGGAGLAGAGLYVLLTTYIGFSVRNSLLASAFLPWIMLFSFFVILPRGPLQRAHARKTYGHISTGDINDEDIDDPETSASLLISSANVAEAYTSSHPSSRSPSPSSDKATLIQNLTRARSLFIPYMVPLLLVYIAEYTINLGVSPTLLFDINLPSTPFSSYRSFYPIYAFLYQIGVFIARSSTPFIRVHSLYLPSLLQCVNLFLLISQSLFGRQSPDTDPYLKASDDMDRRKEAIPNPHALL
ncbi:hypothetical protein B7494_g3455 [Chlorociboria aeruginascens]|nr:hypothetical protein B7494_g3455 [Chlorociboria aeruginascens]